MNMKKIKCISLILMLSIVISLFMGCNQGSISETDGSQLAEGTNGSTQGIETEKTYEYTWALLNSEKVDDDNLPKKWVEENYNIKVDLVRLGDDGWREKLSVLMASDDMPDMVRYNHDPDELIKYADQGVLAELPEDMIKEHMPRYYEYIESFNDEGLWKLGMLDGKHYGLPMPTWLGQYRRVIAWNADWLKNVGINRIPETLSEFEEAFYKFVNEDPDGNNINDTYALTTEGPYPTVMFSELFGAFGVTPFHWMEKDGKLIYGFSGEDTKEALKLLNKWYKDGLIDPEFVTEDCRSEGNDIAWKFSTGKIGYISNLEASDHLWNGTGHLNKKWRLEHPEVDAYIYAEGHAGDNQFCLYPMPFTDLTTAPSGVYVHGNPPVGPDGEYGMPVSGLNNKYILFNYKLEEDQGKYIKLLTVLEDLAMDEQAYISSAWGEIGGVWDWVKDEMFGTYAEQTAEWKNNPDRSKLTPKYIVGQSGNPFFLQLKNQYLTANAPKSKQRLDYLELIAKEGVYEDQLKATIPSQVKYADHSKPLVQFALKAILEGKNIEAEYDRILQIWMENGGDVLTREANEWYSTIK